MLVELVDSMGGDDSVVRAARVSSGTDGPELCGLDRCEKRNLSAKDTGLINMLMRDRHGTPFEAVVFQFRVECPIFVAREFVRHRIASYNETSSRYRELKPEFYCPDQPRPLVQEGKPGAYEFKPGDRAQQFHTADTHHRIATITWDAYQELLRKGVAREVARNVLPLSIYTEFYVTMNLRSLLNFLSLRWAHPDSTTPTYPLYEIEQVAKAMNAHAASVCPVAMQHFDRNGRVAP